LFPPFVKSKGAWEVMLGEDSLLKSKMIVLLIVLFFLLLGDRQISAEENEIDINKDPHGYLFQVDNLKPGDWMPREITIKNDGKQDFRYIAKIGESKSVKGLFEELDLMIKQDTTLLYEGKLKDFKGIAPRKLANNTEEILFFQVSMPYELGNEFQGSSAEVEIIFLAEGGEQTEQETGDSTTGGSNNPVDGSNNNSPIARDVSVTPEMVKKLPNTATNYFNFILIGGLLTAVGGIFLLVKNKKLPYER